MTMVISKPLNGRSLVQTELFDRLVTRIVSDEGVDRALAERIMDQALAYLRACASEHVAPLSPSKLVDIGWHTFILHSRDYAAFCDRVAGRFLHHVPTDDGAGNESACTALARTVAAIRAAGLVVDDDLWPAHDAAKCNVRCSQCKNGCADDPPPAT